MIPSVPAPLLTFFRDRQDVALLVLLILVGLTAWGPSVRVRTIAGALTVGYGLLAGLVIVSLLAHGAR